MPKPSSTVSERLAIRFRALESTRKRIEGLAHKNALLPTDVQQVYEALFVNAVTAFESFLEDLFIGLLVGGVATGQGRFSRRVTVTTSQIARELVTGAGRKYADWFPFERTEERARLFLTGGRPFTSVSTAERSLIDRCLIIRNAIAHRSRHSRDRFQREVLGSTPLPPRERTPAGYLRSSFRSGPRQTRYENLTAELLRLARKLAQ